MKKRSLLLWLFIIATCLSAASCGKVSAPMPIEGSGYPHSYPRQ